MCHFDSYLIFVWKKNIYIYTRVETIQINWKLDSIDPESNWTSWLYKLTNRRIIFIYMEVNGSAKRIFSNIITRLSNKQSPVPPCCACINYQSANKISRKEIIGRGYYNHPRDSILSSLTLRLSFDSWQVDKRGWYPYTDYTSILNLGSPRIAINLRGTAERSKRWCAILISQRLKY